MNNQPPPFVAMPFPFGPQQPSAPVMGYDAPARVRIALEFLGNLSVKTMTRAAVNDISIEQIPGQRLTSQESDAQGAACVLLADYFRGILEPDGWESAGAAKHDDGACLPEPQPGKVVRCFVCVIAGTTSPTCPMCHGSGFVEVHPHADEG